MMGSRPFPPRPLVLCASLGKLLVLGLADPGYPCNRHFLRLVEGGAQLVPVGPEVNYQLTADLVERYWDNDTVGAWWPRLPTRPARCWAAMNWPACPRLPVNAKGTWWWMRSITA